LSAGGSQVSPVLRTPLPHCAPLSRMWTGSTRAPGPGRPPTLLTELLVVGGMQKVAASVAFWVPGAPTRTIGSRKQLRKPPVQTWFGAHAAQLPLGGGLQSVSAEQPRNFSTLQN